MSGVCAILRAGGPPVPAALVECATHALRGRDATRFGVHVDARDGHAIGFGCALPVVSPEDRHDHQPLVTEDGALVLVADVRLDHRAEHASRLGLTPRELANRSDAALILDAYRKWGQRCVHHLRGDYAFALWDARRGTLFCARDPLGQRALCYRRSGATLAVASFAEAVVRLDGAGRRLDRAKVAEFLMSQQDPERTFYEDVRRLPAGHTLVADGHTLRIQAYWSLASIPRVRLASDAEYVEAFRSIWREAVSDRLRSTGEVGVMLSAGLDSSAVAAAAATLLRDRGAQLRAFHAAPRAGFNGPARPGWINDESEDVRAIATLHPNIDLEVMRPDGRTFLDDLEPLFQHAGMPVPNVDNRHWFEAILSHAYTRGVRVMLGGYKGNATISYTGLRGLRQWARTGRWPQFIREIRALAEVRGKPSIEFIMYALTPAVADALRTRYSVLRGRRIASLAEAVGSPIAAALAREQHVEERFAAGFDPRRPDRSTGRTYRERILERSGDAADAYRGFRAVHGIELRDPTSDSAVVEFCLGIPDDQYLRDGHERQLVRRALAGSLPDRVLNRTTRGAQAADWPERLNALREQMRAELEAMDASATVRDCIDVPGLRALVANWPAQFTLEHGPDYRQRLTLGIMVGAFIRWFEAQPPVQAA